MSTGFFHIPAPKNEPVLSYAPGSKERAALKKALEEARAQVIDVPMYIGAEEVRTENKKPLTPPHDHKHILGHFSEGDKSHVEQAINAAMAAKELWAGLSWENRASIFLKAADLLAGPYRYKINAATMLGQSKNAYQAEIDAACELIDFLRFNVHFMGEIYNDQPQSSPGVWNRLEYRPLEGFVFALTPFNFTAIAGNLPTSAALMGNSVVWKPANTQIYAANVIMQVLREAGLPDGVINLIYVTGPDAGDVIFKHKDFGGIHFTGSTGVFQNIWKTIGQNIHQYKSYPRIVGETGGKDFIMVHKSADAKQVATAIARGAFEYQGQKCSAASRCYVPSNLWDDVKKYLLEDLKSMKMGPTEDFGNFVNAVIDEKAFTSITGYIEKARQNPMNEIIAGGKYDKSKGYFIEPTVVLTKDASSLTMCEEIFGPVITIYVYHSENFEQTLELVDQTSPYALTGSIMARDRFAVEMATKKLSNSAGNFYINDKPTGAVVGQQPFGGARGSGTNDKAGAKVNLLRWVSMRTIKETFVTPTDYRYPFLEL
ncbi:MAG: L-glutamate gamma-semialdehyde dehydrogenase [Cytophagales bacterium]|jgi:1-pyrroline-5-carboxylate dehydrogenase|nr:L-glutamate gamma-semialdehyde dehydrogenase [Cytophagales bacterium]MCA6369648.1 L-glutamate gamma-semialdehyde dehydrogenase [Cytophagales bacterium]MCA6369787.1 L-glutamate gamma-semialdehyde dehydrogenase [Cytophagales bacterium]MCA6377430.1 L-glutamate gamma-semialdehyde dehydrogenase [Cytophagales bacterium]MCA6384990.1 L-glutamate gamma-semialdehyde dehydrogenase [Cytophagales bacterium]